MLTAMQLFVIFTLQLKLLPCKFFWFRNANIKNKITVPTLEYNTNYQLPEVNHQLSTLCRLHQCLF